jgi:hypothetical protein
MRRLSTVICHLLPVQGCAQGKWEIKGYFTEENGKKQGKTQKMRQKQPI